MVRLAGNRVLGRPVINALTSITTHAVIHPHATQANASAQWPSQ
jgi:hypothetical protein